MKLFKKTDKQLQPQQSKQNTCLNASKEFYETSGDWFYDMYHSQVVWVRWLTVGVVVLFVLLFLSVITNILLFPLKQKVPYLYTFDKATGEVTKLGELEPNKLNASWEMSRFFLTKYIIARESYDFYNIDIPYQTAWAMSNDEIRRQYEQEVDSQVDTSPYKIYGKNKYIIIEVLSISKLNNYAASIRFRKVLHDREAGTKQAIEKEAIIKWKYEPPETTQKMLDRNPLGFKVNYYQVSQINLE